MSDEDWDDIRVALAVARAGTVSGGAAALGVHHATVIRRIDALESRLGARLFHRNPRGYVPTDAGLALIDAGAGVEEGIARMRARIAGGSGGIEGRLTVTALPDLDWLLLPLLAGLLAEYPALRLEYQTATRLFRLDAGEAHVAIRAGARPSQPDYVVQPFRRLRAALYAAPAYLAAQDARADDIMERPEQHRFVLPGESDRRAPYMAWVESSVPTPSWVVVTDDPGARHRAIAGGIGVGFLHDQQAQGLVEVGHRAVWDSVLWLVTHVDLHRSPKVQAALAALKSG
ncbi:MAG: LysR family transcriptional regulator [Paracoccus sp. (in: a-proteobacteria)]|nr:LysR family transcriptional regulator [Paracoccus sp. (in: a-proteobacteria)]